MRGGLLVAVIALALGAHVTVSTQQQEGFRFRTGVELINVTATVTDSPDCSWPLSRLRWALTVSTQRGRPP